MVMHWLSRTVPSSPITRMNRSKFSSGPVRSNSTAPAPPAEVRRVATVPKLVLVQTPLAGASTARVIVKVVFGAASWMLTTTWATKLAMSALVEETMTLPTPLSRDGRQLALRARRLGLGCAACRHAHAGRKHGNGQAGQAK